MSTAKVIASACTAIFFCFGGGVYIIAIGPMFTKMVEVFTTNTPLYWFNYLHGDMIVWILQMVYFLILAVAGLGIFQVMGSAFAEQEYYD